MGERATLPLDHIPDEQSFTMAETAAMCGISIKLLAWHRDKGDIRYMLFGRRAYRFKGSAIKAFQRLLTQEAAPCPSSKRRGRRTTSTISSSNVVGISEARKRRQSERQSAKNAR